MINKSIEEVIKTISPYTPNPDSFIDELMKKWDDLLNSYATWPQMKVHEVSVNAIQYEIDGIAYTLGSIARFYCDGFRLVDPKDREIYNTAYKQFQSAGTVLLTLLCNKMIPSFDGVKTVLKTTICPLTDDEIKLIAKVKEEKSLIRKTALNERQRSKNNE